MRALRHAAWVCLSGVAFYAIIGGCASSYGDACDSDACGSAPIPDRIVPPDVIDAEASASDTDGAVVPPGTCLWSKSFGGPDNQYGSAVAVDPSGGIAVAASYHVSIDFGAGPLAAVEGSDVAVAKLSPSGALLSTLHYGGAGDQFATALVSNGSSNLYLLGLFKGTIDFGDAGTRTANADGLFDSFFLRIRPDDTAASDVVEGPGNQNAFALAADPSAGATMAGGNYGTMTAAGTTSPKSGATSDAFAVRLQSSSTNWAVEFAGTGAAEGHGVAYDTQGNAVIASWFVGSVTVGGTPHTSAGGKDVLVVRLAPSTGAVMGSFAFGGTSDEAVWGIAADKSGGVAIVGEFAGTMTVGGTTLTSAGGKDAFVVFLDSTLAPVRALRFGGPADDSGFVVAIAPNGNVVVGGVTSGDLDLGDVGGSVLPATMGIDAFVVSLDPQGKHRWSRRFGGPSDQTLYGSGLATAPNGDLVLFGGYQSTIDLGCGPLTSQGLSDAWLAKLSP